MDPIAAFMRRLREQRRTALIPYLTAGYPEPDATASLLDALADNGADIIELGVPFSDPVADGPTIQRSSQRALDNGTTLPWTLDALRSFRARHDTPVVIFSYLNPLLGYGIDRFLDEAADAGADGLLLTDLPAGGDAALEEKLQNSSLSFVRLIAPTTPAARRREIAATAQGFIYYVGRMGVTGARAELRTETLDEVRALRAEAAVPVAVGFGISTPEQAAAVGAAADGVVVGSALINALDEGGVNAAGELMASFRRAIDGR